MLHPYARTFTPDPFTAPRADLKSSARGCVVATLSAPDVLRLHAKLPKLGLKLIQRLAKVCAAKEMHFLMEEAGVPKLKGKTLVDRVVRPNTAKVQHSWGREIGGRRETAHRPPESLIVRFATFTSLSLRGLFGARLSEATVHPARHACNL